MDTSRFCREVLFLGVGISSADIFHSYKLHKMPALNNPQINLQLYKLHRFFSKNNST